MTGTRCFRWIVGVGDLIVSGDFYSTQEGVGRNEKREGVCD